MDKMIDFTYEIGFKRKSLGLIALLRITLAESIEANLDLKNLSQ